MKLDIWFVPCLLFSKTAVERKFLIRFYRHAGKQGKGRPYYSDILLDIRKKDLYNVHINPINHEKR